MIKGEYRKILFDIYDVFGFSESEKEHSLENFKKKFSLDLLMALEGRLSKEQQDWLANNMKNPDPDPTETEDIHDAIKDLYTENELDKISHDVFKKLLSGYVSFMVLKIDQEKASKVNQIVSSLG